MYYFYWGCGGNLKLITLGSESGIWLIHNSKAVAGVSTPRINLQSLVRPWKSPRTLPAQALRFVWESSARGKTGASYNRTRRRRLFLTRSSSPRALLSKRGACVRATQNTMLSPQCGLRFPGLNSITALFCAIINCVGRGPTQLMIAQLAALAEALLV